MTRTRARLAAAFVAAFAAAGCWGDGGRGSWTATVEGPVAVGAALVEVQGEGIIGFGGSGDTRVFADPTPAEGAPTRLVVVSPGGVARFSIEVEDVSGAPPVATLVSAADVASQPLPALGGFDVRVAR